MRSRGGHRRGPPAACRGGLQCRDGRRLGDSGESGLSGQLGRMVSLCLEKTMLCNRVELRTVLHYLNLFHIEVAALSAGLSYFKNHNLKMLQFCIKKIDPKHKTVLDLINLKLGTRCHGHNLQTCI
jgi:hypothetical protein